MYKDYSDVDEDVTGVDAIKNSIRNILLTPRGSLPGKPRFGSDIYKLVFSQLDALTESVAKNYINESLIEYEPRINIEDITLTKVEEFNKLIIQLSFSYVDTTLAAEDAIDSVSISVSL
ncbi:baseplate wedge subunit [Vibrio phage phiKT1024]|nr:baseplate wedge subunit [Vibrio phage phiKT1024]